MPITDEQFTRLENTILMAEGLNNAVDAMHVMVAKAHRVANDLGPTAQTDGIDGAVLEQRFFVEFLPLFMEVKARYEFMYEAFAPWLNP